MGGICQVQRLELEGRYVKLHGALVQAPGSTRGILLLGHSGAGKSTLGTALLASGWALLADDAVFVDIKGKSARPGPRRVALRRESQALRVLDSYQLVQHFHIDWQPYCTRPLSARWCRSAWPP